MSNPYTDVLGFGRLFSDSPTLLREAQLDRWMG